MISSRARATGVLVLSLSTAVSVTLVAQAIPRSLHVSVLDQAGNAVSGLGPSDFIVREDKAAREVLRVTAADDPMQIAVLVDDSAASSGYFQDFRASLATFIATVMSDAPARGKHAISITTLASRPTIITNYTTDQTTALKGAGRIFPQQGTGPCLLDGIAEVSQGMLKRDATRPVIVVLTTDTDDSSYKVYDQVLDALHESGATLYVFGVGFPQNNQRDRGIVLAEGTENSGGFYENVLAGSALSARMKRLADQLTHEYLVTYARRSSLIPPQQVAVTVTKTGLIARGTLVKDESGQGLR